MSHPPRILVVGDGVAAWLTAVALALRLGSGGCIRVVRANTGGHGLGPFGNGVIGLPEWQLTPVAQALSQEGLHCDAAMNPSLGIAYAGWGPAGAPWFLPYGDCGAALGSVPFPQIVARARLAGRRIRLADYSLAALAAQAERFAFPEVDPRSPRSSLAFAAHLEADGLAALLRRLAISHGVAEETAPMRAAFPGPYGLSEVALADGSVCTADLFVDTSGLLAGDGGWESWGHLFACNAVRRRFETEPQPAPYALMACHDTGWTATVPVAGCRHVTDILVSGSETRADGFERFDPGVAVAPWHGNMVSIGAPALLVEPLLGTALLTATTAAERLAGLLPHAPGSSIEAAEYNRLTRLEAERLRDMLLAFWRTNGRLGQGVWDRAREAPVPDELARKLALYESRGTVPIEDGELFEVSDWVHLLDGQGVQPRRCGPVAAAISEDDIDAHLDRLRKRLLADLQQMPPHAAFLQHFLR